MDEDYNTYEADDQPWFPTEALGDFIGSDNNADMLAAAGFFIEEMSNDTEIEEKEYTDISGKEYTQRVEELKDKTLKGPISVGWDSYLKAKSNNQEKEYLSLFRDGLEYTYKKILGKTTTDFYKYAGNKDLIKYITNPYSYENMRTLNEIIDIAMDIDDCSFKSLFDFLCDIKFNFEKKFK